VEPTFLRSSYTSTKSRRFPRPGDFVSQHHQPFLLRRSRFSCFDWLKYIEIRVLPLRYFSSLPHAQANLLDAELLVDRELATGRTPAATNIDIPLVPPVPPHLICSLLCAPRPLHIRGLQ
jgi:hypothetical protein